MKITGTIWFTTTNGVVGIVFGVDEVTGKKKAYIGTAPGSDEESDAWSIAEWGVPFGLAMAKDIVQRLTD